MKDYLKLSLFLSIIFIIGATPILLRKWTHTGVFNLKVYLLGAVVCFGSPLVLYLLEFIGGEKYKNEQETDT